MVLASPGVVSTGGFTVVTANAGTMTLWFVTLGEGLRGASVSPVPGASPAVVSSDVAFAKLPPWMVVALSEAVSVTVMGVDTDMI